MTWEECRAQVDGVPGAEYKGFAHREEALGYLGEETSERGQALQEREEFRLGAGDLPPRGALFAYVDGSYSHALKKYAFGCVFILSDGRIYTEYGNGDNPQSLAQRNVTGEMLGAMYATRFAIVNGFEAVEIFYDYEGIEKWVTGAWRSKTELTQKYARAMRGWSGGIRLSFTKVAAHTNVLFNELADQTAKRGLTEGNGVPGVKRLEEMKVYGTGTVE